MKRKYPDHPVVSVSATIFRENEVLLIQRGTEPLRGYWSLPGGAVELGETVEQAVIREIQEECGLEITVIRPVEIRNSIIRDQAGLIKYHYVLINFLCRQVKGEPRLCSEVTAIKWVPLAEVGAYQTTDGLLAIINKAAAM